MLYPLYFHRCWASFAVKRPPVYCSIQIQHNAFSARLFHKGKKSYLIGEQMAGIPTYLVNQEMSVKRY
jgi:hypothetical protein